MFSDNYGKPFALRCNTSEQEFDDGQRRFVMSGDCDGQKRRSTENKENADKRSGAFEFVCEQVIND